MQSQAFVGVVNMVRFLSRAAVLASSVALMATFSFSAPSLASVFSLTPDLPPSAGEYRRTSGGVDCFSSIGYCLLPGAPSGLAVSSSSFDASGQTVVFDTLYTFSLTDILFNPILTFFVYGQLTQVIDGRTAANQVGDWATSVTGLNLSGVLGVQPVSVVLNPSEASVGHAEVAPVAGGFDISNFFDVFATLTVGDLAPITVNLGKYEITLVPVDEPIALATLTLPLIGLGLLRRRQRRNGHTAAA